MRYKRCGKHKKNITPEEATELNDEEMEDVSGGMTILGLGEEVKKGKKSSSGR